MEKIARTGVISAGTSRDAMPFAYANNQGQLVGYSVEMLNLIKAKLEKDLGKKLELKLVGVTPAERISKILKGEVDIICDASSFTWERDQKVDFSVSYGGTGTQLLVKKGSPLSSPATLIGKRIGALPGTTNEQVIKQVQPRAQLIPLKTRAGGYTALQEGKIDAFAADGILLEGWLQTVKNAEDFDIIPPRPLSREGIACMVPENNSKFLDSVNFSLIKFMQGFVQGKSQYVTIFDRWFGSQGNIPLSQDLRSFVVDLMQLVIDLREKIPQDQL
jgi:polar amino acid transport system substrate-binding protein